MRIVLKLELTMTIDVLSDEVSNDEQMLCTAECKQCKWRRIYSSPASARRGLAAHMRFCEGSGSSLKRMFDQLVTE